MNSLKRRNYTIYTDKVFTIEDDKEYSIALISDIHYGSFSNKRSIELLCDNLKNEQVDIIVFVGNILDENSTKEDMEYATNTSEKTGIDYYKVNRTIKNTLN